MAKLEECNEQVVLKEISLPGQRCIIEHELQHLRNFTVAFKVFVRARYPWYDRSRKFRELDLLEQGVN